MARSRLHGAPVREPPAVVRRPHVVLVAIMALVGACIGLALFWTTGSRVATGVAAGVICSVDVIVGSRRIVPALPAAGAQ